MIRGRGKLQKPSDFLDRNVFSRCQGERMFVIEEGGAILPGGKVGTITVQTFRRAVTEGALRVRFVRRAAAINAAGLAFACFADMA